MTRIHITLDELDLFCPRCECELEEIAVHRLYEMTFECPSCFQEIGLCLYLE
jgi:hypothetical protein